MGTALGLAITGLVFDLAGGTSPSRIVVDRAFSLTAFFLGAAATVAVLLSAIGERGPFSRSVVLRCWAASLRSRPTGSGLEHLADHPDTNEVGAARARADLCRSWSSAHGSI